MKTIFIGLVMIFILSVSVFGAAYLKYDGIDGESKDSNHDKWIDVLSIDWGAKVETDSATARNTGRIEYEPMVITKRIDSTSSRLFNAMLENEEIDDLTFSFDVSRDGKSEQFFTITIEGARIIGVSQSVNEVPTEEVSFYYNKISMSYGKTDNDATDLRKTER